MDKMEQPTPEITALETQPLLAPLFQPPLEAEIVVAGHICLDIIPTLLGDAPVLAPGKLLEAGPAVLATGGAIANTGLALHKLGVTTGLMGKVGDDLFGQAILRIIESHGVGLARSMVVAQGEASSYSIIISHPGTDRSIIHAPGCNDTFSADDVRYDLLEKVVLFHFGYPPIMARMYQNDGAELADILQRVKALGVTTSLDLSLPDPGGQSGRVDWSRFLAATLPNVDIFLPSVEELLFMLRRPLFDKLSSRSNKRGLLDSITPAIVSELGKAVLDMGAKIVGIKLGHRGFYLCTANSEALEQMGRAQPTNLVNWSGRELWAPCFVTPVVGTTGSGDATIAGFLLGLLRGMQPVATLSAACAVGACSVEAADALTGIRSWPETLERIAAGWSRLLPEKKGRSILDPAAFKWRWQESQEVWFGPTDLHY